MITRALLDRSHEIGNISDLCSKAK